jgi:hypothetical protein
MTCIRRIPVAAKSPFLITCGGELRTYGTETDRYCAKCGGKDAESVPAKEKQKD